MYEQKHELNGVIKICFEMELMYKDKFTILATECGIAISFRYLKRLLRQLGQVNKKEDVRIILKVRIRTPSPWKTIP